MENISPSLVLVWDVLRAIEAGFSVSSGVSQYLHRRQSCEFTICVKHCHRNDFHLLQEFTQHLTPQRRLLLQLIAAGVQGESIYDELRAVEVELIQTCEDEISQHLTLLPFKMLIPLLGLILPSLMIVLITPLIRLLQL